MNVLQRTARHARLSLDAVRRLPQPSVLVLFVNSTCNMRCEHCFYWRTLNRRDDLALGEIVRKEGRYGAIVEPMLQWAKVRTIREQRQVVPCGAGRLSVVVYANGDVSLCDLHLPVGNLRQSPFPEIWAGARAAALRGRIQAKECHCTTEVFLWPSIVYQPLPLLRAMVGGKAWQRATPLGPGERLPITLGPDGMPVEGQP